MNNKGANQTVWMHMLVCVFVVSMKHNQVFPLGTSTVVPTKSDSAVILCLQLLSKTLTCTLNLSACVSIDHLCINPILRIDSKSLITL